MVKISSFLRGPDSYTKMRKVGNRWKDYPKASAEAAREAIDLVDALTLAVMRREGVSEVYSNDRDFDKIARIKRISE